MCSTRAGDDDDEAFAGATKSQCIDVAVAAAGEDDSASNSASGSSLSIQPCEECHPSCTSEAIEPARFDEVANE
ncbi:MAG: hypothetical protein P4L77_01825 [Sulfuriferula sp.]|nr:hypothetical protein [Sulfuriferula sp.]